MERKPICACVVKFLGKHGTDDDLEFAKKKLVVDKNYTVYRIEIENWKTLLYLKGVAHPYSGGYNSVMFKPVEFIF